MELRFYLEPVFKFNNINHKVTKALGKNYF